MRGDSVLSLRKAAIQLEHCRTKEKRHLEERNCFIVKNRSPAKEDESWMLEYATHNLDREKKIDLLHKRFTFLQNYLPCFTFQRKGWGTFSIVPAHKNTHHVLQETTGKVGSK